MLTGFTQLNTADAASFEGSAVFIVKGCVGDFSGIFTAFVITVRITAVCESMRLCRYCLVVSAACARNLRCAVAVIICRYVGCGALCSTAVPLTVSCLSTDSACKVVIVVI